jgi:hypothetical protein
VDDASVAGSGTQSTTPDGRNTLRPLIPPEEIEANAQAFLAQARMVLRCDDPDLYEVRRNSEWYEPTSATELVYLLSMVTHARLASRDMFRERIQQGLDRLILTKSELACLERPVTSREAAIHPRRLQSASQ